MLHMGSGFEHAIKADIDVALNLHCLPSAPCVLALTLHTRARTHTLARVPNTWVVGLDVTHECRMSAQQLEACRGRGRHGTFLHSISQFYLQYHR